MRVSRFLASLLFFALVAQLAAAEEITLTDQAGRVVTLTAPVKRAVLFETYEMIPALGAWDQIAGVSHYAFNDDLVAATKPDLAATAVDVGSMFNVNVEILIALKPDVVIIWRRNEKLEATLADNQIPVVVVNPTSLDSLYEALSLEGRLFGKTAEADHAIEAMRGVIDKARARVADIDKAQQRAGVWMMSDPTRLSGSQSMSGQLLALASVRNLAADAAGAASEASVSLEQILSRNPNLVYIWGWARFSPQDLIANPQWAERRRDALWCSVQDSALVNLVAALCAACSVDRGEGLSRAVPRPRPARRKRSVLPRRVSCSLFRGPFS